MTVFKVRDPHYKAKYEEALHLHPRNTPPECHPEHSPNEPNPRLPHQRNRDRSCTDTVFDAIACATNETIGNQLRHIHPTNDTRKRLTRAPPSQVQAILQREKRSTSADHARKAQTPPRPPTPTHPTR